MNDAFPDFVMPMDFLFILFFIFRKKICVVALFFQLRVALEVERCLRRSNLFMVFGYLVLKILGNFQL